MSAEMFANGINEFQDLRGNHDRYLQAYQESGSVIPFNEWLAAQSHSENSANRVEIAKVEIVHALLSIDEADYRRAIVADEARAQEQIRNQEQN